MSETVKVASMESSLKFHATFKEWLQYLEMDNNGMCS